MSEETTIEQGPTMAELLDMVQALREDNAALKAAVDAERASSEATRNQLATARMMLANPAFVDAHALGSPGAGHDGGACSSSGEVYTKAEALAEYNKITDPKAKTAFRRQYSQLLGIE